MTADHRQRRRIIDGLGLLALAAVFLWFPHALKQPRAAHHQVLAATEQVQAKDPLAGTQVFIIKHNGYGAMGVVVNRGADGGPLKKKKSITFFGLDKAPKGATQVPELGIAYHVDVADAGGKVYQGRAEWAPGQLDREIANGAWKIVPADKNIFLK